jgi:cell division protein FtsB
MYKNWWLRFGCFLSGYNFNLIKSCSEASKKAVKKYTAALLIVMILWALIGFLFTREYIKLNMLGASIAGVVMVIIIIQVERQIILGTKNRLAVVFRIMIGLVMAILGSVIIDQIIFKEDIEKQKLFTVENEVSAILPQRSNEINAQIAKLDSIISQKDIERQLLIEELTNNPTIKIPTSSVKRLPSKVETTEVVLGQLITKIKDTTLIERTYTITAIPNPKGDFLPTLDTQIENLRNIRNELTQQLIDVREGLRKELIGKKGFLDELEVMFDIILSSWISGGIWLLWFMFFLAIELFVLVSKYGDKENDYEKMIQHQKDIRIQAIEALVNG